jgi:hypothetical protein
MAKQVQAEPDMTERMVRAVMKALYLDSRQPRRQHRCHHEERPSRSTRDRRIALGSHTRRLHPGAQPEGLYKRAELEFAVLKEKPNFKPEQFIEDRFYKSALKALANDPGAKP